MSSNVISSMEMLTSLSDKDLNTALNAFRRREHFFEQQNTQYVQIDVYRLTDAKHPVFIWQSSLHPHISIPISSVKLLILTLG